MAGRFTPQQRRTLAALAEAVAPSCAHLRLSSADVDVAGQLDRLLGEFDPQTRLLLRALASALRIAPLLRGRGATLPRLPRERREAFLREALRRPGLDRDVVVGLRALCEMVYAGDPRVREQLGDSGEPLAPGHPVPPETPLPVVCHPEMRGSTSIDCDVVIVGSGAGGATVAQELAQAGLEVVVVEEGGPVERDDFRGRPLHRVVRYYRDNGLTTTFGTPAIPVPMGRVVGGTTVVNSGTCLRAPDSVLRGWAEQYGVDLAAPEALGPAYDEVSARLNVQPVGDDVMGGNGRMVRRGAEALGLRAQPIPRPTRDCAGTGECAFGCPRDAKQAMHLTALPAAVRRGARLYGRCRVERLLLSNGRANGVVASILDERRRRTGQKLAVRARAVFLCAGALCTPSLLLRHGLGRRGGPLGRHLRIHPGSGITGRFSETIKGWQGVMQSLAIDDRLDRGILLEATFPPLGMSYSAAALPGVGEEHAELVAHYAQMASIGSIVSDTSSGRVHHLPRLGPVMQYRMNREDAHRTVSAIGLAARVLFAAGATEVYPGVPAVPRLRSLGEVEEFERRSWPPRELKVSAYHPMGTARMGADPARSVCDPSGRVHGTENLYVADTSLFPGSTHVNPQLTLMALCLNLARRFLDQWPASEGGTRARAGSGRE